MIELIVQRRAEIEALCRRYGVRKLELFGSAARGDYAQGASDVDFFYEFDSADAVGLADRFFGLHDDLERLLGVGVDLISSKDAVNPYFLQVANRDRTTLYAA